MVGSTGMWIDFTLQIQDTSGLLLLVPLLICCMLPLLMRQFQGRQPVAPPTDTDVWFMPLSINDIFQRIKDETDSWREEAMTREGAERPGLLRKKPRERYVLEQTVPARLIKLSDPVDGTVVFEFTDGRGRKGSLVRVTHESRAKPRIQALRASLPIQHPYGEPCTRCGGPLLPGFKFCPYCSKRVGE